MKVTGSGLKRFNFEVDIDMDHDEFHILPNEEQDRLIKEKLNTSTIHFEYTEIEIDEELEF